MYGSVPEAAPAAHPPAQPERPFRRALMAAGIVGCALVGVSFTARQWQSQPAARTGASAASMKKLASDDDYSDRTTGLLETLMSFSNTEDQFLFGHHMTSYDGQFFRDKEGDYNYSDVYNATGEWPVVYGGNMGEPNL